MPALSLRLPEDLDHRLGDEARLEGLPRSEVVRQAISDFLARREKERFMAELVVAAKAMVQNPVAMREARELAEEFLPLDNEALDIAEGRKPGEPVTDESAERWWK
jgi:metal-responsive CopG/Arc/MetJ family transcriptional regulator